MLLILYGGYLWVGVGFIGNACADLNLIPRSIALHALSTGAISHMIIGMIARVSLGHTGRPINATPAITLSFILIFVASLLRTMVPFVGLQFYLTLVSASGIAWLLGFGIVAIKIAPILINPRADGNQ